MPENLIESILFGHEKGSFTGATERHIGKFVEASGGTLFLDEIGELPPAAQVKLLRALQEDEVEPVGARKPVRVDVRVVSATNRDLIADVKQGRFREDLFYRLHVFPLAVPPLRERQADVPPLARHFVARFAAEEGKRIRMITPEALRLLGAFYWPGNIRQLENAIFRAVVLTEGDAIDVAEFPQITAQIAAPAVNLAEDEAAEPLVQYSDTEISPVAPFSGDHASASDTLPTAALDVLALLNSDGEVRPLEALEAEVIRYAITHYRGQMSEVARRLQIGRSTLYRKLEALGLNEGRGAANGEEEAVATARQPMKIA
jgi:DNA-binding NtrC family response regulator